MGLKWALLGLLSVGAGLAQVSFHATLAAPTQGGPVTMATADFNGDGVLDLAVSDVGSGVLAILLGKGDGTFQQKASYSVNTTCELASIFVGSFTAGQKVDL